MLQYIREANKVLALCPGYILFYRKDLIKPAYIVKEFNTGNIQYVFFPRTGVMHVQWQFNLPANVNLSTVYLRKKAEVLNAFQKVIETDGYRVSGYVCNKAVDRK